MDWNKENQESQVPTTPSEYIVSNLTGSVKKNYVPTPKLSERKRALFPKHTLNLTDTPVIQEETSDSSFDSFLDGLETYDETCPTTASLLKTPSLLTGIEDRTGELLLLSDTSNDADVKGFVGHLAIEDTSLDYEYLPQKNTPKTPYETLNTDLELPRINNNRKSLVSTFNDVEHNLKRKYPEDSVSQSPIMEPQLKLIKLEKPKVRTSLFSNQEEDLSVKKEADTHDGLSPKLFYRPSLSPTKKASISLTSDDSFFETKSAKKVAKQSAFLCSRTKSRKSWKRNSLGDINAGVRTGIRKPKKKPKLKRSLSNRELFKAEALKFLKEKSIWNVKIESKTELPSEKVIEMDQLFQEIKKKPATAPPPTTAVSQKAEDDSIKLFNETFPLATRNENVEVNSKPRKFFKSKQPTSENMTIKILDNVNLNVANGKVTIQSKPYRRLIHHVEFDPVEDASFNAINTKVEDVLKSLTKEPVIKDTKNLPVPTRFDESLFNQAEIKEVPTAVPSRFDNSVLPPKEIEMAEPTPLTKTLISKLNNPEDIIMSPTSVMCNMTSGLALTSPKKLITKAMNLTDKLLSCPSKEESKEKGKLFPIFTKYRSVIPESGLISKRHASRRTKMPSKMLDPNQYQIDAGQKKWGIRQCPECEFVYSQNEPEDEQDHYNFHHQIQYRQFNGWKNERILDYFVQNNGRIIEIRPSDTKVWWKKVQDLLKYVVDKELGTHDVGKINTTVSKVYLYVVRKEVVGLLAAEPMTTGYRMVPDSALDVCRTTAPVPIKCGISRIWVSKTHRRKQIATHLVDTFRKTFTMGCNLNINEFAISAPSDDGKHFYKTYSQTDAFLVYL